MGASTLIVLLRGVNVGGRNRLPMERFKAACEAAGAGDVRTHIQSGNAVLSCPASKVRGLADRVRAGLAADGPDVPVVVVDSGALKSALARGPFRGADPGHLHYGFLEGSPKTGASLDPAPLAQGERVALVDGVLHLHLPWGVARTRLTNAWMDRTLGTVVTLRNRATCEALVALAQASRP